MVPEFINWVEASSLYLCAWGNIVARDRKWCAMIASWKLLQVPYFGSKEPESISTRPHGLTKYLFSCTIYISLKNALYRKYLSLYSRPSSLNSIRPYFTGSFSIVQSSVLLFTKQTNLQATMTGQVHSVIGKPSALRVSGHELILMIYAPFEAAIGSHKSELLGTLIPSGV